MRQILFFWAVVLGISVPLSVQAQTVPGADVFLPSSPWVVGKTQLAEARGLRNINLPCVMVNEFSNGFTMRVSGGGRSIIALAIDFRQDIFRQGARYPGTFTTDTGFSQSVKGSAFSPSILIFNMRDATGFYNNLQNARWMGVDIGQNRMRFATPNIGQALGELEACFTGARDFPVAQTSPVGRTQPAQQTRAAPIRPAQSLPPAPAPGVGVTDLPESFEQIQTQGMPAFEPPSDDTIHISRQESQSMAARRMDQRPPRSSYASAMMKSSSASPAARPQSWTAQAGENMRTVLMRWGAQAGVDVQWNASAAPQPITAPFSTTGTFEQAVRQLLAQNAAAGLRSNMSGVSSSSVPLTRSARQSSFPSRRGYAGGEGGAAWYARAGSSLQSVLEKWAERGNVSLQWYADQGFAVKQTVSQNGTYEAALQALLQPYQNDAVRPAARLNKDPVTGMRILVVETHYM